MGLIRDLPDGKAARYFELFGEVAKENIDPNSGTSFGTILGNFYDIVEDPCGSEFIAIVKSETPDEEPETQRDMAEDLAIIASTLGSIGEDLMKLGTDHMRQSIKKLEEVETGDGGDLNDLLLTALGMEADITKAQLEAVTPLLAGFLKAAIPALVFVVGQVHFEAKRRLDAELNTEEFVEQANAELQSFFEEYGVTEVE